MCLCLTLWSPEEERPVRRFHDFCIADDLKIIVKVNLIEYESLKSIT